MKEKIITEITQGMLHCLDNGQLAELKKVVLYCLEGYDFTQEVCNESNSDENSNLVSRFLSAKRVEKS